MQTSPPPYAIAGKQTIAQTPELRVTLMDFAPGQEIPWHRHNTVDDTSFCLKGAVEISTTDPDETHAIAPGEFKRIPAGTPHRVRCLGPEPCRVLLVQGVGAYDFLPA
ncbi:cupin domain-containing protein [Fundidesulfovibrio agrisoli]|uniref:cupin domain-containing protein n=1 Tax=Fundidesulfovibrio agrisoli TaxID=2922717 RepID=UPI001FAE1743|nr:cupin domain-containing protein [Fundidesulfovibrio agrisoli]